MRPSTLPPLSPVGLTSRWVAASRASESAVEAPLFEDPHARALAGEPGFAFLAEAWRHVPRGPGKGPIPFLSIRTRFLDDALRAATGARRQVVVLAAGMDARAFRLDWPVGTRVFEVDRADVLGLKDEILAQTGAQPRCERIVVRADLESDWRPALLAAGFDASRPTAFLIEGLLVYLERQSAEQLLRDLSTLTTADAWLGADIAGASLLASPHLAGYLAMLARAGAPWRFGTDDPGGWLASFGWRATVVAAGEPAANFGRWVFPVPPRGTTGFPFNYLATAVRA